MAFYPGIYTQLMHNEIIKNSGRIVLANSSHIVFLTFIGNVISKFSLRYRMNARSKRSVTMYAGTAMAQYLI